MEREYAFLSHMIPLENKGDVKKNSRRSMQDAADALQWHIYNGLCQNFEKPIKIINFIPIYSYPQYYRKAFVKKTYFDSKYESENINIGFCNIKLIRTFSKKNRAYCALKEWVTHNDAPKTVFLYTASGAFLEAIQRLKKKYDIEVCVIIADLPNMRSLSSKKNVLRRCYESVCSKNVYSLLHLVDYYVLLTKQMAEYLHIDKPYCVMEGIATESEEFETPNYDNSIKTVFYAGTLHRRFGVLNLVEAFMQIPDPSYQLILCGVGDCEKEIIECSKKDRRIKFYGQLPRTEVLKLQSTSTVLVNPRQNGEEFTKYSFPSKNLEYLSSGIPFVAYKLDGMPDEYDDYIFYVNDNSIDALKNTIMQICEYTADERQAIGLRARSFVSTFKNEVVQTKKICNLVDKKD